MEVKWQDRAYLTNAEGHKEYTECAYIHRSFPRFQCIPPFLVLVRS